MATDQKTDRKREPEREEDKVTEAGLESFPASDPPSFNQSGTNGDKVDAMSLEEREHERPAHGAEQDGTTGTPDAEERTRQAAAERDRRIAAEHRDEPHPTPDPVRGRMGTGRLIVNTAIAVLVVALLVWLIFG